ncbi:MAG: hypothetical protein ACJ76S_00505 [Solirubrobacteraceae bacterium]|jgi:hypothetical protein
MPLSSPSISIRSAYPDDADALHRLAALDSAPVPESPVLVADVGGELRAALSLSDRTVIADPFVATAHLVVLLEVQAAQLRQSGAGGSRGRSALRAAAAVWRGLTARDRGGEASLAPTVPERPPSLALHGLVRAP